MKKIMNNGSHKLKSHKYFYNIKGMRTNADAISDGWYWSICNHTVEYEDED